MQRTILIVPELIDPTGEVSLVGSLLREFELDSRVLRIPVTPAGRLAELAWFGVNPWAHQVHEGPLMIAALGAEPPTRAICMRLDLMSLDEKGAIRLPGKVESQEAAIIEREIVRLGTKLLTVLPGIGAEHGLVAEYPSLDCRLNPTNEAVEKQLSAALPEGEGEEKLRRLIDDSINLLSDLEFNRRREDEGKPSLNLLWPWGAGTLPSLPNLMLRAMEPLTFLGDSLRLKGLCRLLGAQFVKSTLGFRTKWSIMHDLPNISVMHVNSFKDARAAHRFDAAEELWEQIVKDWISPLTHRRRDPEADRWRLVIAAPSSLGTGLIWILDSHNAQPNGVPFHEKVLGDPKVPGVELWQIVQESLLPS